MAERRWVWDLLPLDRRAVKNQQVEDDGTPPGQITTIQVPEARRRSLGEMAGLEPPPAARHVRMIPRKVYVPDDDDLDLLSRWRPDDDPHNPAWYKIKACLRAKDHDPDILDETEAPVLLTLLAKAIKMEVATESPDNLTWEKILKREKDFYTSKRAIEQLKEPVSTELNVLNSLRISNLKADKKQLADKLISFDDKAKTIRQHQPHLPRPPMRPTSPLELGEVDNYLQRLEAWCDDSIVPPAKEPQAPASPPYNPAGEDAAQDTSKKQTQVEDDANLSPAQLAKQFKVPYEALKKRLERLRVTDHNCFIEVANRNPKEPQFLYCVGAVRHIIEDLKTSRETSRKRPAKK